MIIAERVGDFVKMLVQADQIVYAGNNFSILVKGSVIQFSDIDGTKIDNRFFITPRWDFNDLTEDQKESQPDAISLVEYWINDGRFAPQDSSPVIPRGTFSGFMDYNDTTGAFAIVANTWTDIPNDGLGASTNKASAPIGVTELIDTSTGYLDTSELSTGDGLIIRNHYKVTPNTNNALLEFRYSLGAAPNAYILKKIVSRLDSGSNIEYEFSLQTDYIYMGDDNTRLNPIKPQFFLSTGGTFENVGTVIHVIKY